jgi:hypothetical protein
MSIASTGAATAATTITTLATQPKAAASNLEVLTFLQQQTLAILATLSTALESTATAVAPATPQAWQPLLLQDLWELVARYCDPITPEEAVSKLYHPDFIKEIGLGRLAGLPVITGASLDVDKNLPWTIDESFPAVDVTKMPFSSVVRGESAEKTAWFGTSKAAFIAMRYFSSKGGPAKVEFILQEKNGVGWGQNLFGWSTRVTKDDYARLRDFMDGKPIQGAPEHSDTYIFPNERFTIG